jgi:chloramphenicol 3-O-phosphotransferase
MMKGPFYQHASLQGISEDDFVKSATQDLIDYATTQAPKVLLLGKPRSGKTTLARILAQRLNLVHVNVENWLEKLMKGIVDHAEDEPDPETE